MLFFLQKYNIHYLFSGCCIEDKLFPKTNSLLDGRAQPLADIKEFALKIQVHYNENQIKIDKSQCRI